MEPPNPISKRNPLVNIHQAAALQFSFAAVSQSKAVGQHVMAKDMREALNYIDVIDFDTGEDAEEAQQQVPAACQEVIEQDKRLLTAL